MARATAKAKAAKVIEMPAGRGRGARPDDDMTPPAPGTVAAFIKAPNMARATFELVGTAPFMQARFAMKARNIMANKMKEGSTAKSKRVREARDFEADYKGAMYLTKDGLNGIPASAFRNALISACRTVGFKMTLAKLSLFIEHDAVDKDDGTPLVLIKGEHEMNIMPARNATGVVDLRSRPLWREWSLSLRVRWDADQFTVNDVLNLLARVGMQVGIGEGRPDSRASAGLGYGLFDVVGTAKVEMPR